MTVGQPSFADLAMARRRPSDLDRIAALIQWVPIEDRLRKLVERHGRPPFPPLLMLRALLLGQWHTLSDRDLEAALDDRASFRRFCGLAADDPGARSQHAVPVPHRPDRARAARRTARPRQPPARAARLSAQARHDDRRPP